MDLFLFKPHVEGPSGAMTTPDIVIDRLFLAKDAPAKPVALDRLTMSVEFQVEPGCPMRPAYALTALGGGVLIGPALLVGNRLSIARKAWRLKNLADRIDSVTINGTPLPNLASPDGLIKQLGDSDEVMPRGYMVVCAASAPADRATLEDSINGRLLTHRVSTAPVDKDRWQKRPNPRYSVGPTQRDVEHFI